MQRRQSDIDRESVKDVASRLRQFEDHNLAIKLQEEEFNHHYNRNRSERKVMGVDTRKSKEEQELEKRYALEKRLAECREIATRDEAIAKQLQQDLEAEERRLKQEQDLLDQEIARRMQSRYEPPPIPPPTTYEEDERLAREMHERYLRRMRGLATAGSLDERTRNDLIQQQQIISPPSSLQPRQSTFPDELGPPSLHFPATHFPLSPTMPPSTINLPPLPSYTEVCTPTTPVLTNTISSSASIRSISPATSALLTSTAAAIQPARAPLHEIIPPSEAGSVISSPPASAAAAASTSINYSFLTPISNNTLSNPPATAVTVPVAAAAANINNNFLQNLHPTNPFKESLEAEYRTHNPESPLFRTSNNNSSQSEFGLPPFSEIYLSANSISRDRPMTSSSTTSGMPMPGMVNVVQEIRTKISNPNNL